VEDNLTDQQRAEQVRIWLRENGWYLLAGLALGLAGLFGWRQWSSYDAAHAEQASALYEELLGAIRVDRSSRAEEIAAQLAADFASTPYLDQARFAMARMKLERSQPEEAVKYLELVVKDSGSTEIATIARLRLARVLAQEEKYDDALKVLAVPKDSAFEQRFHDVRGDVYYAMGRLDEARAEYEAALKGDESLGGDQAYLRAKLAELPGGAAPPPATAAAAAPAAD
jgi:predicted negative regulator of RcsB-dependent stress response